MNRINLPQSEVIQDRFSPFPVPAVDAPPKKPVRRLRLWPAFVVLVLQGIAVAISVTPSIDNFTRFMFMIAGPGVCLLLFDAWLLLASRMRWYERIYYIALPVALAFAASQCVHESMKFTVWYYGTPTSITAITAGLLLARFWRASRRVAFVAALLLVVWVSFGLVRLEGVNGSFLPEFAWRWEESTEPSLAPPSPAPPPDTWKVS